jgi:hypothetical protein
VISLGNQQEISPILVPHSSTQRPARSKPRVSPVLEWSHYWQKAMARHGSPCGQLKSNSYSGGTGATVTPSEAASRPIVSFAELSAGAALRPREFLAAVKTCSCSGLICISDLQFSSALLAELSQADCREKQNRQECCSLCLFASKKFDSVSRGIFDNFLLGNGRRGWCADHKQLGQGQLVSTYLLRRVSLVPAQLDIDPNHRPVNINAIIPNAPVRLTVAFR